METNKDLLLGHWSNTKHKLEYIFRDEFMQVNGKVLDNGYEVIKENEKYFIKSSLVKLEIINVSSLSITLNDGKDEFTLVKNT